MELSTVTLRKRKQTKDGKESLYLEFYYGTDGSGKPIRKYETLKIYLSGKKRKTNAEKKADDEKWELAKTIRAKRELEERQGIFGVRNKHKPKKLFLDYFETFVEARLKNKGSYDNWNSTFKHLKKFCHADLRFEDLNPSFVTDFRKYLLEKVKKKDGTNLAQNTANSYFNKFRTVIKQAYEDGFLAINLLKNVDGIGADNPAREYLTIEELSKLAKTDCKYEILKKAFLFCCLSGLRWSDAQSLLWSDVRDEDGKSKLFFKQQKTQKREYHPISKQARELLGKREGREDRVFIGLKYSAWHNSALKNWVYKAGIDKDITFHCSRHTYAILLLSMGTDIFTVSKMLGHKNLKTTEIYAKILDTKKEEAAEKIPIIEFNL